MSTSRPRRHAVLGGRAALAAAVAVLTIPMTVAVAGATPRGTVVARTQTRAGAVLRTGPVTGTSCVPSCDLWAETGTMSQAALPGSPVGGTPVWGYNTVDAAVTAPGGPTLVVDAGVASSITLHNKNLPSATSLMISGQAIVPDTTGVTAGNAATYSFPAGALKPGTYLYEAGLTSDGPRQVAMGIYGALIVRPTAATFTDEAVLVLGEIDPALNAAPGSFDMGKFAAKYWLINGKTYPNTDPITTAAGNTVLLRYVNAGLQHHSMGLLGLHQTVIARDGNAATNPMRVVAQTIPAGSTLDALVTMPASPPANAKYALFEQATHLDNAGLSAGGTIMFGGMLTFLTTSGTTAGNGPVTTNVALAPNPTSGPGGTAPGPVTLTASITGAPDGAEYFVDTLGTNGAGCAMSGVASVTAAIPVAGGTAPCVNLTTLSSGNHTFYVHGHDLNGWGAVSSAVLDLDKTGPSIASMNLTPNPTNGTADAQLVATANDASTGNQNVVAAEYNIDGGAAISLAIATPATVVALSATLTAMTVNGLTPGNHAVNVRAQDALGNWGAIVTITLVVDKTGPSTSAVSTTPTPTNGTFGVQVTSGGAFYQRIDATVTDPQGVVAAEYFIDGACPAAGAGGTGGAMFATAGVFSGTTVTVYGAAELYAIAALSPGNHTIYVHGKDTAGNWGPCATTTLVIDKTGPTVSALTLTPPAANNTAVTVAATATDAASAIAGGELFVDTVGATGSGIAMSIAAAALSTTISGAIPAATVAALSAGNHTVYVRARDVAGNWGATSTAPLLIDRTAPTFSGITLNPTSIASGTATVNLTVNGAVDPLIGGLASGVVGGEYWFGTTNITPGTGTAFTGLTNVIATGSLTAGTYTVRVRIRDAAGNWSSGTNGVRTATLTVTGVVPDAIFSDGLESGNTTAWSSVSTTNATRLNVTATAALFGSFGLQAQGNNTNYVQYNFGTPANPSTATFDARFYFNPNGNTGTNQDIFTARTTGGATVFRVRYRWNGGSPQVQIQVGTGTANTTWTGITSGAANRIEVVWQSGTTLQLYVNGTLAQTLTANVGSVGAVRLGSVTSGGNAALELFDAFASKRSVSPLIGP